MVKNTALIIDVPLVRLLAVETAGLFTFMIPATDNHTVM